MLVVALGPRSRVASLEATAIASGGCRGNAAGARGTGLMPRRHRAPAGRTRARQRGHRRAGFPDALRATVHWLSTADGARRRSEEREPRREAGRFTDRLRDFPYYAEQYAAWQRARWHLGLGEGPVDVLGTRGDTPLAAWFAGTGQVCYESLLQRAAGDDLVALRACDAVQGMRHTDGKRRALDRVSRLLRLWRLPARGAKVIRWPGQATGCIAASALEEVRARLTGRGRRLWHCRVRKRTRVVLPRCQTYASHWNHIRCSRASEMLALLATGAAERPPRPEAQAGMVRVKRYWRLQVAISPAQALRQGRGEVNALARKCFGASFRCPGRLRTNPRGESDEADEAAASCHGPGPSDELTNYRAHLTSSAEGEVLVQEDKDKSAAWRVPARVYLHWVVHLLVADTVHWRRVGFSVHGVSALYHLRQELLLRRFAYMASAHGPPLHRVWLQLHVHEPES